MLREHARSVERLSVFIDLVLVVFSIFLADKIVQTGLGGGEVPRFLPFVVLASTVWFVLLRYAGFYRSIRTRRSAALATKVLQTSILAGVLNAALLFLIAPGFSRRVYVVHLILATLFLIGWKLGLRTSQRVVRRKGYNFRRLLIVGTEEAAGRFIRHIEEHRDWGFQIVGCVQGSESPPKQRCCGHAVLGRLNQLVEICKSQPIDEVIVALPVRYMEDLEKILPRLEAMGITVRLALDYYRPKQSRVLVGHLGDDDPLPVVTYYRMSLDPAQLFLKRMMDVVGGVVGLLLTGALLPFVAVAVKLDSPGPVFFGQKRVGQNGRLFTCYKFRTMHVDAEARKHELMAQNEMQGAMFKMKNDPRITRVGGFLRKTSLDEFPQFWNVLTGDMSLVGTRPPTPEEVAEYEEWQRARICIKPGLTGMWQTSGRNQVSDFDKICRLDLNYIDNWSVWLDVKLLAKTVAVVMLGVGAR